MRRVGAAPLLAVILLIAGQQHARAAEPKMVTLSCDGTLTHRTITENKPVSPSPPEQMQKVGVVVNLDERTVSFLGYVAWINDFDAGNVDFTAKIGRSEDNIRGTIDRELVTSTGW